MRHIHLISANDKNVKGGVSLNCIGVDICHLYDKAECPAVDVCSVDNQSGCFPYDWCDPVDND